MLNWIFDANRIDSTRRYQSGQKSTFPARWRRCPTLVFPWKLTIWICSVFVEVYIIYETCCCCLGNRKTIVKNDRSSGEGVGWAFERLRPVKVDPSQQEAVHVFGSRRHRRHFSLRPEDIQRHPTTLRFYGLGWIARTAAQQVVCPGFTLFSMNETRFFFF